MKNTIRRPVSFVLASTSHGSLLVNRNDYNCGSTETYGVGHQLLSTSSFEPSEVDLALELLESRRLSRGEGVMAIDCGANIGVHTIEWARFMVGWGNVIAIEAQERIYYALAGNIVLNNCFNARAVWAAAGAHTGSIGVPIVDYTVPSSFGSLELRENSKNEFIGQAVNYDEVQSTVLLTIDDLNLARLDLVKIDVEGMEIEVLKGASQTIRRSAPHLILERIKSDEARLNALLEDLGYEVFQAGNNVLAVHMSDAALERFRRRPPQI